MGSVGMLIARVERLTGNERGLGSLCCPNWDLDVRSCCHCGLQMSCLGNLCLRVVGEGSFMPATAGQRDATGSWELILEAGPE